MQVGMSLTLTRSFRMFLQDSKQQRRKTQKDGLAEGPTIKDAPGIHLKIEWEWGLRRLSCLGFYCYNKTPRPKST